MARKFSLFVKKTCQYLLWRGMTSHFFTGGPLAYLNWLGGSEALSSGLEIGGGVVKDMEMSVRVLELSTGNKLSLKLCHPNDADPGNGSVSILTPLGSALMNANSGDLVDVVILSFSCKFKML
ncbi:Transcription elongation factor, GreA/GreB, C-term [Modicisalibacter muralis]|uniref:Transcription elongation factor, GreA/GreB, C-term n=1 Tax=Modicisalibacter muralis TaxID=119000 RepID=A0A1G9FG20_9GAMM|nr:GreA/GreB family elongation factor [Halomonas muralis]SDK87287.1 Transcription elongation factor, GreA/GreB, C-term [Halomonas muralis]